VIAYTDEAGELVQADTVAQFGRVYAKARLGEELSVPVVLKRGYTSQIPQELDELLAKQPKQPFALALYGGYEAGVIRKVGKLVGRMTYGVSADKMETYFQRSFRARDDLPIGHYEYANALTYVYGDDEENKVIDHLERAAAIKPISAMEALEVAHCAKTAEPVSAEAGTALKAERSMRRTHACAPMKKATLWVAFFISLSVRAGVGARGIRAIAFPADGSTYAGTRSSDGRRCRDP
jgi:hypothetical protein